MINPALEAELWMGETGGAFNSGQNTTTNTFMSHRWYLGGFSILKANLEAFIRTLHFTMVFFFYPN